MAGRTVIDRSLNALLRLLSNSLGFIDLLFLTDSLHDVMSMESVRIIYRTYTT